MELTEHVLQDVKAVLHGDKSEGCGWKLVCSDIEEWGTLIQELSGTKHQDTRRLVNSLKGQ